MQVSVSYDLGKTTTSQPHPLQVSKANAALMPSWRSKKITKGKLLNTIPSSLLGNVSSFLSSEERIEVSLLSKTLHSRCSGVYFNDSLLKNMTKDQLCEIANKRMHDLQAVVRSDENVVTCGQGEYLFYFLKDKQLIVPNEDIYKRVHEKYLQIKNEFYKNAEIIDINKKDFIIKLNDELSSIDKTLHCLFIPRTLFSLMWVWYSIEEDLDHGVVCGEAEQFFDQRLISTFERRDTEKCWHPKKMSIGSEDSDYSVKFLSRLNHRMIGDITKLMPEKYNLSTKDYLTISNYYTNLLKEIHPANKSSSEVALKSKKLIENQLADDCLTPDFIRELSHVQFRNKPVGITNRRDSEIIKNALILECSKIAKDNFIFFRGSNFKNDSVINRVSSESAYSLSFGSGIFDGIFNDRGACPLFHGIKVDPESLCGNKLNHLYAIAVPFRFRNKGVIDVRIGHAIEGLSGKGELFHPRTQDWQGSIKNSSLLGAGFHVFVSSNNPELAKIQRCSTLDKELFINLFDKTVANTIFMIRFP